MVPQEGCIILLARNDEVNDFKMFWEASKWMSRKTNVELVSLGKNFLKPLPHRIISANIGIIQEKLLAFDASHHNVVQYPSRI